MKDPKHEEGIEGYSFWEAYGGWKAFFSSLYLWISMGITIVLSPAWATPGWWDTTISVISSLMGFTLAGFAILVGFGDDTFKSLVSRPIGGSVPVLLRTAASFSHFIFVQVAALATSLVAKFSYAEPARKWVELISKTGIEFETINSLVRTALWFVAFFLFVYTVTCTVAATKWVYELCRAYVFVASKSRRNDDATHRLPEDPS